MAAVLSTLSTSQTLQPSIQPGSNLPILQPTPYDNDVTLLYKWADIFQIPVKLMIIRPRTIKDKNISSGTQSYVYDSLPNIIQRLYSQGESPASIYDIVTGYNKMINIDDIVMTYYDLLRRNNTDPNLYSVINKAYRGIDNTIAVDKFESLDDLQKTYDSWIIQLNSRRDNDVRRLQTINDIQERLRQVDQQPKISFSPVVINSTIMSFSPNINGRPVTQQDGLDIFNSSVVSQYVPFIRYNDKYGKSLSKVYTGTKIETRPNYSVTVIPSTETLAKNTIYMSLWLGDPNNEGIEDLHDAPRESFFTVVYHLDTNYLTVESPIGEETKKGLIRNEKLAYQRTQSALPNLSFGTGKEVKVRGEFDIWGMDFDETSFLDMVLLEPLMNVYLYIEENIKPFALKKRLDVHYRSIYSDMAEGKTVTEEAYISNSASVSVTLTPKTTETEQIVEIKDPVTGAINQARLPMGSPYIHVTISQAESRTVVNDFIPIFRLLMRYYLDNYNTRDPLNPKELSIYETYRVLLPELNELPILLSQRKNKVITPESTVLQLTKKTKSNPRGESKIKSLEELVPNLFVDGYARRCQCKMQPIIVPPEEVELWKQKRIGDKERQVMPFPKDNPEYFFVCPDDDNPYPGVKINHDLPNREEYPYIPCCFKKDQMTPGLASKYRNYVENKPLVRKVGAKAEKKISTRKILVPDKVAFLPRAVESIVKRYSDDHVDMVRYGVIYSPNSLIHCVCVAVDDPGYFSQIDDQSKERYVTRIRQYMLSSIKPSLLKQEFYDHSDQEIMNLFGDNSIFLDPSLFYRALEETFKINIYVFSPPLDDETELGSLDVPRFNIFHARPLRLDRPTVVVIKTWGSESDALEYPQCELVVDYDIDNLQIMKLFGPEMTEICHSALQDTIRTITWSVLQNDNLDVHSNIYYYIDHLSLFQAPAVSQFIDNNGKMRALTLNVKGQLVTIATIPSQPENLPVTTEIQRAPIDLVLRMFREPTGITKDASGKVDGLWFQIMDIVYGEYVPIIPTTPTQDIINKPIGPQNPLVSSGISITGRLSRLRRTLNIIIQIIRWLYELARSKQAIDPPSFASQFMLMDQSSIDDSSLYYDLSKIPRRLPNVETIQDAIKILEPLAPTLFNSGRIVMYSPQFAERIIKMLRDYNNLRYGMDPIFPEFIEGYYETESDFIQHPNSKIFLSDTDLNSWLTSLKSSQNYSRFFNIRQKIEIAMGFTPDPYIYQDEDGKIYIVQNVVGGSKAKALAVASTWAQYRVNIGPEPIPLDIVPVHMIYGISSSSTLIPVEDNTNNGDIFLKLVYYGTPSDKALGKENRYGALLEIL